jgi:hypothetical protein
MALDGNAEAVKIIKPNALNRPGHSIGEDEGSSDKFRLSIHERA